MIFMCRTAFRVGGAFVVFCLGIVICNCSLDRNKLLCTMLALVLFQALVIFWIAVIFLWQIYLVGAWTLTCGYCFTRCWGCRRYVKRIKIRTTLSPHDHPGCEKKVDVTALTDWQISDHECWIDLTKCTLMDEVIGDVLKGATRSRLYYPTTGD